MEQINNNAVNSYAADYQYRTEQNKKTETAEKTEKKTRVSGKTIGEPQLSERAAKYYEKLKKKYSNMDFVLVSPDKKEEAERNKGMYKSSKELLVLINSDKIEKMAEDEEYRKKYETILSGATAKISQMKSSGNASFFAVIDKSLATQCERIAEKKAENAKKQKADRKKETERAAEERRKDKANAGDKARDKVGDKVPDTDKSNLVTVTASS